METKASTLQNRKYLPLLFILFISMLAVLFIFLAVVTGYIGNQETWRITASFFALITYCTMSLYFMKAIYKKQRK